MKRDNMKDYKNSGEFVSALRAKSGLSVRKFAEVTGLHFTSISFIENGKRKLTFSQLSKIISYINSNKKDLGVMQSSMHHLVSLFCNDSESISVTLKDLSAITGFSDKDVIMQLLFYMPDAAKPREISMDNLNMTTMSIS